MPVGYHSSIYFRVLVTFLIIFQNCVSQQFNQRYTGVTFEPYVKLQNGASDLHESNYNLTEIKVMLEVILERFSKVTTWEAYSKDVPFIKNITYYNNSYDETYIAEIAAKINRQRNNKSITILQGIWQQNFGNISQTNTEVLLAQECAEKANEIYAGTVEGLVFSRPLDTTNAAYSRAKETLKYLTALKNSTDRRLKFGSRMVCKDAVGNSKGKIISKQVEVLRKILQASDFVICTVDPGNSVSSKGAEVALASISRSLLKYREGMQEINPGLEVMAQIGWASEGDNKVENLRDMRIMWEGASQWAGEQNFTIWFHEAFDSPYKEVQATSAAHKGWWRLVNNSKSHVREGYIEKILEIEEPSPAAVVYVNNNFTEMTINSALFGGIGVGVLLLVTLLFLIAALLLHVRNLNNQLSKKDIREFVEGMSSEVAAQHANQNLYTNSPALMFPYDKSFEIRKDHLTIHFDKILGMGQFGCVYNALLKSKAEGSSQVALKTAKNDCPRSALKGILSEIKIMIHIGKHENIVALKGAYTAELRQGVVYIATEFCGLGSLEDYLRKQEALPRAKNELMELSRVNPGRIHTSQGISIQQMIQWSQEIACGMEYLGTKNVIHADLATRNVLLTVEKTSKITDFGLSRRMYDYTNYVKKEQEPLPWRWMAIESLKRSEFSSKSDVWSYGVTLWEIFSMGDVPYPGLEWTLSYVDRLVNGLRLGRPARATPEMYQIMVDCWHPDHAERPDFSQIQEVIKNIVEQPPNYVLVNLTS